MIITSGEMKLEDGPAQRSLPWRRQKFIIDVLSLKMAARWSARRCWSPSTASGWNTTLRSRSTTHRETDMTNRDDKSSTCCDVYGPQQQLHTVLYGSHIGRRRWQRLQVMLMTVALTSDPVEQEHLPVPANDAT